VELHLQAKALTHRVKSDGVDLVHRIEPVEGSKGFACGCCELLDAGRRKVLELRVVPGDAKDGGEARVKPDQGVRVSVGDGINGGPGARWR
jgi:hypothetical protein